jgi:quinol monooxygenase YgiN
VAITINIYYTGKNGSALKFAEEMVSSGVVSDIRAEDGNIRYDYFSPLNDSETVLLIDSWENQKALDIHHVSPMMEQITRLREKYNLSMKVERYISDGAGIPYTDKKYIRSSNHDGLHQAFCIK